MTSKKRFIAGAVCPRCGEMDKLVSYSNEQDTIKECVACGFEEKQAVQVELDELGTRVNHLPEDDMSNQDGSVQVVQIMDLPQK